MQTCLIIGTLLAAFTLTGCGGKETPPAKDAPVKQPNKGSGTRSSVGSDTTSANAGATRTQGSVSR